MKIFLVGFMCSGKTTVGRLLAPMVGLPFIDLDREVEKRAGPLLPNVEKNGEAAFRELETEVLDSLLVGPDAVIATGGGTPCEGNNMERMRRSGVVVWIKVPLLALMPRIERAGGDRPLLFGLKGESLVQRVQDLLERRIPIYDEADIVVKGELEPSAVARIIHSVLPAT